jgi:hypothetical protein
MILAAVALLGIAVGVSSWFKPKPRLRVIPYMAKTVLAALDPIDLAAFSAPCNEPREAYRERARAPEVSAPDLSCLARSGEPAVVGEYLAEAPLADPADPLRDRRLFRNAVSLMLGLGDAATDPLCGLLGDSRERVRRIAAVALARSARPAATACLLKSIDEGDAIARPNAVSVLDVMLAKGEVKSPEGFALAQGLVADSDPTIRVLGIRAMVMFNADVAAPAITAAASDPDPTVAQAAKETLATMESIRKVDLLRSGT